LQCQAIRLRGTCIGGWMNMEDFINGYPGVTRCWMSSCPHFLHESLVRKTMAIMLA
jgi:hypothetical protein